MPEPDLIQQQRDILRAFRQASARRAQAEAQAETQRKTERAAADAELARVRQSALDQLAQVQKMHAEARHSVSQQGLGHLLTQGSPALPAPAAGALPPEELAGCVSAAEQARQGIDTELAALQAWREAVAAQRRLRVRLGIAGVLTMAAVFATVGYLGYRTWQSESQRRAAAAAVAAIEATGGTREKDGMTMVNVPAGDFQMGSPDGEGESDEHPPHKVYLDAFWVDRTEVTNASTASAWTWVPAHSRITGATVISTRITSRWWG